MLSGRGGVDELHKVLRECGRCWRSIDMERRPGKMCGASNLGKHRRECLLWRYLKQGCEGKNESRKRHLED